MKILFLCHEMPTSSYAGTWRVLYSVQALAEKYGHDITILGFKLEEKKYPDLSRYARIETIEIEHWPGIKSPGAIIASLVNIVRGRFSFFSTTYSPKMAEKLCKLLMNTKFDLLVIDHPVMLPYAEGLQMPKVLLEAFEMAEITRMDYENEKNRLVKIARWVYYRQMRHYADKYAAMDKIIAVSEKQKAQVLTHRPDLDIAVIPLGVDTDYYQPREAESPTPNLVITGTMSIPSNKRAVLLFCRDVYPVVKAGVKDIKLYIVGSNPDKELLALAADKSIEVTGYVDDLRPYLDRAWAAPALLLEGFGTKIRLLQIMAMGKPVVANTLAAQGLGAVDGESIIIADQPREMARRIIELIGNQELRKKTGAAARQLMETDHNWNQLADRLNEVLEETVKKYTPGGVKP